MLYVSFTIAFGCYLNSHVAKIRPSPSAMSVVELSGPSCIDDRKRLAFLVYSYVPVEFSYSAPESGKYRGLKNASLHQHTSR